MQVNLGSSMSTTLKIFLIGVIVLILQIPLTMLGGLMRERVQLREEAYDKVARGWGGALRIGGPMLVIPTQYQVIENSVTKTYREPVYVLPRQLDVSVAAMQESEPRYVGIYRVPVFIADFKVSASFDLGAQLPLVAARYPDRTLLWQQATLRVPVNSLQSLRQLTQASFSEVPLSFSPVTGQGILTGLEAPLSLDSTAHGQRSFELQMKMAGSRELSVLPLGSTTQVRMQSDWPHPSFQGAFLPAQRTIDDGGFDARWQVLELNRSYGEVFAESDSGADSVLQSALGVGLHQTVDVYLRGERAIKYAILFIALTFLTFFAWEQLSQLRLHPLQYLLVGLALSIFYLLLIALSEHVSFLLAYWSAASALVALIGIYLAGALRARRRGILAGGAMALVYGILYALVLSEDYALLMGAIVLFIILGAVMVATRHVNWYAPAAGQNQPDAA